ncbi:type ISP restriction/modification enzyme [Thermomonas sp. LB-4]|uniref:type ISP restriction/modification enzyme n=1 Tax=Thermomonas sp. LB-4 TaxID=3102790 RepID=UPI002EDB4D10
MSHDALKHYLSAIEQALKAGNATEHTHRPALKALIEALGGTDVRATNEPKQIACGAPDFIVTRGVVPLGYIEAKDVGIDLAKTEKSEQLGRYRESLGNLVLTDYLEFRWYLDGELRLTASLPRPDRNGRIRWNADDASEVAQLLGQFIAADIPLKATPQDLATRMAGMGKLIRGLIEQTFKSEGDKGELHGQFEAFRKVLIESLTAPQFADMYAQTLCYGLFAARCNAPAQGFTRQKAASALPKTNPFLRKLFNTIAGPDLDERIAWAVDQLAELLARADMAAILADFGKRTRQEDPVVHFYETFLAAYDPKMREARGVYYTPEPVVGYIVRSIDAILRRDFGMPEGLAHAKKIKLKRPKTQGKGEETYETHRLQILDPATGTGTFLYAVIAKIREQFDGNAGAWPGYVAEHLLPRLFGFELLMAPYAVAHMKLGLELEQSGYDFASDERLGVFLTNTLEEAHELTGLPLFTQWLAEESRAAASIKRDAPVMVVLGNPPYSGHSSNKGEWIEELMQDYKQSPELKKPAQAKWLSDDYVKFIRFAQWRIEQTGHGVLGFVTNHGYLDNPTFMDMRRSLLREFDELYLLDLHGSSKKKETTPDGGKDENVFDIQQGVAIGIFVRRENTVRDAEHLAKVFHADAFGLRREKYSLLDRSDVCKTEWRAVRPAAPTYLFLAQDAGLLKEYESGWSLRDVFSPNGDPAPGIVTTHDEFAISWNAEEAADKVERLLATATEAEAREQFKLCSTTQWNYARAKAELADNAWRERIVPILYRPFDVRWTVYDRNVAVHRRERLSEHMLGGRNYSLITARSNKSSSVDHFFMTTMLQETKCGERTTQSQGFPLWLNPVDAPVDLLDSAPSEKRANLAPEFVTALTEAIGATPSPEDTLAYIYAVLYAPSYRARYADFLKRDFPRIPLTTHRALFDALVGIGRELIALHVMDTVPPRITTFDVPGDNTVDKVRWAPDAEGATGRVYINAEQCFGKVPAAVWNMHIGGYRVAEKWLKDRKGRPLTYDDLTHYQSVIAALARTLELQESIDAAIHDAGGWPLT